MFIRIPNPVAVAALLFLSCSAYTSCKKADLKSPIIQLSPNDVRAKFFAGTSPDPRVMALKEKIYREEQTKPYVTDYVQWAGFPHWDKAVVSGPSSPAIRETGGGAGSNYQVIYVPFTRDSSNTIGAVLIEIITPRDTILKTVYRWQYNQLPFKSRVTNGPTAEDMALFFMGYEHYAFGNSWFQINDTSLFHLDYPYGTHMRFHVTDFTTNRDNALVMQGCHIVYVVGSNGQVVGATPEGPDPNLGDLEIQCDHMDFSDEGGSGGNNSGSGFPGTGISGTGGGGGWNDNPCRSISATGGSNPCDDGPGTTPAWTPTNDPMIFDPNKPFDNLNFPIDVPDEAPIDNGIDITLSSAAATPPSSPIRLLGHTTNRKNTEDMLWGTDPVPNDIAHDPSASDDELFQSMTALFDACTIFSSTMDDVGHALINRFRAKTGGVFHHDDMDNEAASSGVIRNWLRDFGNRLRDQLRIAHGVIANVPTIDMAGTRPRFSNFYHRFHGLQICVNDTEYTEVLLTNYSITPEGFFTAGVTIVIHDHFGLDHHDAVYYQGNHAGFAAWYILQRNRGYRPFETEIKITGTISGQL
jgi:hypothetical protein